MQNPPHKSANDHPFTYVLGHVWGHKTKLFLALLSILTASCAVLSSGIAFRLLVEEGFQHYAFYELPLLTLFFSIFFLAVGSFGRSFYAAWIGEKITTDMRVHLFEKLLNLDVSFFDTTKAGEIVAHFTEDLLKIQNFFGHSLSIILRNTILFVGSVILMFLSAPWLFIQTIGCVFIIFTPLIFMGKKIKKFNKEGAEHKDYIIKITDEVFNAIKTVKAFVQEEFFTLKFRHINKEYFSIQKKRLLLRSFFVMLTILLVALFIAYIAYLGFNLIEQNRITHGQLGSFLYFTLLLASALGSFPELITDYHGTLLAIENVRKLEGHLPCITTPKKPKRFQNALRGIVAVHKVSFAYPSHPSYKVISDLTISLSPGERLAIVGPSGSGKSSLFSLLLRFYDPQSGVIYLDGLNIKDIPLKQLRQIIGIVPQDPDIFSMSIYENIIYGNPSATPEDIQNIVEALQLEAIFEKLPHGPHTLVGNKGIRLSGGQKQRIAIARALVKKPKLLLLDEATSHLDAVSEEIIQKCLREVMKQCSTIVVAHRLSTVLSCDRIAVLNNGTLEEIGTHAELIALNGLYRQLASIQFQDAGRFKA